MLQTQKKEKKVKERDSGVKAITTALKALPPEEQVSTLLAKYAEMAEENKRLQVHGCKAVPLAGGTDLKLMK